MQKKQVSLIDVGSSKITAIVGERGINKTFLIKAKKEYFYDGFADSSFFEVENVKRIILSAAEFIKGSTSEKNQTIFVGVPGEFTSVVVKDSQISFQKKKKITDEDVDALYDAAFILSSAKHTLINRSAIAFELDDYRRLSDPVNEVSAILKGKLSFVLCSNYFIEVIKPSLKALGFNEIEFISVPLAEAMFLVSPDERDRVAIIVDIGYITSTLSIIQGDGIIYQKSFGYGGGYITACITESLEIDFEQAENLKRNVNICREDGGEYDIIQADNGEYYSCEKIRRIINDSLDQLCEEITIAIDNSGYNIPEYVPLSITGGGVAFVRGAKEKISNRLGMNVKVIAPKVPLMDKPTESSILSLLNLVFED